MLSFVGEFASVSCSWFSVLGPFVCDGKVVKWRCLWLVKMSLLWFWEWWWDDHCCVGCWNDCCVSCSKRESWTGTGRWCAKRRAMSESLGRFGTDSTTNDLIVELLITVETVMVPMITEDEQSIYYHLLTRKGTWLSKQRAVRTTGSIAMVDTATSSR